MLFVLFLFCYLDSVLARIEVINIQHKKIGIILTCSTICTLKDGNNAIEGDAMVLISSSLQSIKNENDEKNLSSK